VWWLGEPEENRQNGEAANHCHESCCTDRGRRNVVRRALEYGFLVLPRDIGLPLLAGVVIAGTISAVVPANFLPTYLGGGIVSIAAMMLLGLPLYVCASASVPIAAGLIHAGVSPGAALAFLISGPASNPATLATVWKVFGRRTTLLYLVAVVLSAIGGGLLLDWLMAALHATVPPLAGTMEHVPSPHAAAGNESVGWLSAFWAVLLLAVVAFSLATKGRSRGVAARLPPPDENGWPPAATHERLELAIGGMTCEHCATAVAHALSACRGVDCVKVDLAAGRALVDGENLDADELSAAVRRLGYSAGTVPPPTV
jgi:copper chaperone CopZ